MVNALISATDATNITITGANGTIDGNGWAGWPSANWSNPECGLHRHCAKTPGTASDAPGTVRPPQLVAFTRSSWVTITNTTIANPACATPPYSCPFTVLWPNPVAWSKI